jgi:hypothetical protein
MQRRCPNVLFFGDASRREFALTFDDDPHPRVKGILWLGFQFDGDVEIGGERYIRYR